MSDLFNKINPKFVRWFDVQPEDVRADIIAQFESTADHDDIAHADKSGLYARQHRTLEYAAAKHGYDFT